MDGVYNTIVGGALVIIGAGVTGFVQWCLARRERAERRQRLYREKLEELCKAALDSEDDFHSHMSLVDLQQLTEKRPLPAIQRAMALALIYFPELVEPCHLFMVTSIAHHNFVLRCFNPDDRAPAGGQAARHPGYQEVFGNLHEAKTMFWDAVKINAPRYTQA